MNKRNLCLAAALCLCLCACGKGDQAPVLNTPVADSRPQQSGILTDVGQAETLQDYYDRTAIIGRNERIEGSFIQTQNWALEYAMLEYPGCQVNADFVSGYQAPEAMFKDDLRGGVARWSLEGTTADGQTIAETVQIFYFSETADGLHTQCFSGLLTGDRQLASRPEAYAYLALDTRFANRMQKLSTLSAPEGALCVELNYFESDVLDCQTWLLSENTVVALARYQSGSSGLLFYHLEGAFEPRHQMLEGIWNYSQLEGGVLTLEQYAQSGDRQLMEITLKDGLPTVTQNTRLEEGDGYRVGGYTVTWEDGSLYLGSELLLEGGAWDVDDITTTQSYQFQQALDDHRFLYALAGWEWVEGCGIYDIETRTDLPLRGNLYGWGFSLPVVRAEVGKALAAHLTEPGWWGLSILDLTTLESTGLTIGHDTEEDAVSGQLEANRDLSRLAVLHTDWESNTHVVRVYDTASGQSLFQWEIPGGLVAGQPQIQLVGDNTLMVTLRRWDTDTQWLYRMEY